MRSSSQRAVFALVATVIGVAVGIVAGNWTGREIALQQSELRLDQFAQRNQQEGDANTAESRRVLAAMNASPYAFCSDDELGYFRKLVYASHALKEAGRMQDGRIACSTTLGRSTILPLRVRPDFSQPDGTLVYTDIPAFRVGDKSTVAVQLGNSYIVYSPFAPPIPTIATIHYTVMDKDAATRATGRLSGDIPQVPMAVLTGSGRSIANGSLYVTRCSADNMVCGTAYMSIADALQVTRPTQILFIAAGALVGGLLGFLFSRIYRSKTGLHHQLLRAIRRDALRVVYQPIVDLETGRIVEAEALVRWTDDEGQSISPDVFVKVAEERGFVGEITKFVVRRVLRDFAPTLRARPGFRVNVNIAAPDLADSAFLPMLDSALMQTGVKPSSLGIEITESYTARQQVAKETILRLRKRGHYVHIDDFGTGYSSLAYLHDLSVDAIKIDKAFTKAIGTDAVTVSILPQILTMAETLGLRVVVEGIETPQQARYFAEANQQIYAQGWLYGRPVPPEAFLKLLQDEDTVQEACDAFEVKGLIASAVAAD